jgi:hypothetical protein
MRSVGEQRGPFCTGHAPVTVAPRRGGSSDA